MKVIVYVLGFGYIAIGALLILYTRQTVDVFKELFRNYPLKPLAVIPAILGLLFLVSAASIAYPWVFVVIGVLAIGEAVFIFTNPRQIYSRLADWYFENISDQTQRLFGIISIIFGTAVLTWIR